MSSVPSPSFPVADLLPKKETTAQSFLTKHPHYDGRGVRIAIFDTGVDPGAAGMQFTSEGTTKIVGMHDASGAGDTDTSTVLTMNTETREITGLSGRTMRIPDDWICPDNQFHAGIRSAFDLFPAILKDRIVKEYNEKILSPPHKKAQTAALKALNDFNEANKKKDQLSPDEKLQKEELQSAVDLLTTFSALPDAGPSYDCLVWFDGHKYNAVIDSEQDLEKAVVLQSYSECLKYGTLGNSDRLNYAVNIHENGNLLEIVSMVGAHGTHVASIAAANFPEEAEKNGVAPGAEIVNVVIGYQGLGSMETTNSLTRAFIICSQIGVDVINMSYGESSHWMGGRVMSHLSELVNKYGIFFCSSAGNSGPAYSTIGTPPISSTNAFMSIGAYVSPEMMLAEYSLRSKLPGMNYTWTSRGPTPFGDTGVSICAPGAAVTSVPNYLQQGSALMNGTSMASPNAAGCIALILSALKQEKIAYSNFSVRRAVENTALKVPNYDPHVMGHGMIQVDAAVAHLREHQHLVEQDVRFQIKVDDKNKGVYRRIPKSEADAKVHTVTVEPKFLREKDRENSDKINFNLNLVLTCDAAWIEFPKLLTLPYTSRTFAIRVDTAGLDHGVHYTLIQAFDSTNVKKGAVFSIPVTIMIAEDVPGNKVTKYVKQSEQVLKAGQSVRYFMKPPVGSTAARIKVTNKSSEDANFFLHTMQLIAQRSCKQKDKLHFFTLQPGAEAVHWVPVVDHEVMELALSKWWATIPEARVAVEIVFAGLSLLNRPSQISMQHSSGVARFDLISSLGYEDVNPTVVLDRVEQTIRPSDHKIAPLNSLYILPEGRPIHENTLTYNFSLSRPTELLVRCPLLRQLLYESPYDCQISFLYDSNKKRLSTFDFFTSKFVKLEKGDHVIRMHARHESVKALERLNDLPLSLVSKLPSNISPDCYSHREEALTDGKKFPSPHQLKPGTPTPLFIAAFNASKLPKGVTLSPGMTLTGRMSLSKDDKRKKADEVSIEYFVDIDPSAPVAGANNKGSKDAVAPASAKKSPAGSPNASSNDVTATSAASEDRSKYRESLMDLKIQWIAKSRDRSLIQELVTEVSDLQLDQKEEKEINFKLHLAQIQSLQASSSSSSGTAAVPATSSSSSAAAADPASGTTAATVSKVRLASERSTSFFFSFPSSLLLSLPTSCPPISVT